MAWRTAEKDLHARPSQSFFQSSDVQVKFTTFQNHGGNTYIPSFVGLTHRLNRRQSIRELLHEGVPLEFSTRFRSEFTSKW